MPILSSFSGSKGVTGRQQQSPFTATGGTITEATITGTTYKVHTFTDTGTFQVLSGKSDIQYLVIAGGGSGGGPNTNFGGSGGGGGAGGLLQGTISNVTPITHTITVGNGTTSVPNSGGISSIGSLVTTVGGGHGGRGEGVYNGTTGGSGGGAGRGTGYGDGTAGQGNAGGAAQNLSWGAGSGGGAGGAGVQGGGDLSSQAGGASLTINFNGTSTEYARGGAGGSRDGGGATYLGENTGAGGGGGANGRKGIVMIRYVKP
jgi:hypothetical protein